MVTVDFNRLVVTPGFRILDVGCGSGRHTGAAYQLRQVTAVGADIDFSNLIEARNRLRLHDQVGAHGGGRWALAAADVLHLPFRDNCFDLVVCSEVLEHIAVHRAAIREIIRVLKPGRNLVVSVPRYWPERICWALSANYRNSEAGHVRIFRQAQLVTDLERAGMKKWAVHFAHSLHTPFWWLKCLVGPDRDDSGPVNLYHRFLTWDIMRQPPVARVLEQLLNPLLGKSLVVYLTKQGGSGN